MGMSSRSKNDGVTARTGSVTRVSSASPTRTRVEAPVFVNGRPHPKAAPATPGTCST